MFKLLTSPQNKLANILPLVPTVLKVKAPSSSLQDARVTKQYIIMTWNFLVLLFKEVSACPLSKKFWEHLNKNWVFFLVSRRLMINAEQKTTPKMALLSLLHLQCQAFENGIFLCAEPIWFLCMICHSFFFFLHSSLILIEMIHNGKHVNESDLEFQSLFF